MNKERECIKKFIVSPNMLIIECNKYSLHIPIIHGSITMHIINDMNEKIGLNELCENDNIIIFYREINDNNIKPLKIIKLSNYILNDDSCDEYENIFI